MNLEDLQKVKIEKLIHRIGADIDETFYRCFGAKLKTGVENATRMAEATCARWGAKV